MLAWTTTNGETRLRVGVAGFVFACAALCACLPGTGATQQPPEQIVPVELPDTGNWLRRVARGDTGAILANVALDRLLESLEAAPEADTQALIDRFSTDMSRLQVHAGQFMNLPVMLPLSGEFLVDAVSTSELDQQGLSLWQAAPEAVEQRMAGIAVDALLAGNDDLAAGWLASALRHTTVRAGLIWRDFLQLQSSRPDLVQAALGQMQLLAGSPATGEEGSGIVDLDGLLQAVADGQPVTAVDLGRVRFQILQQATDSPDELPHWQRLYAMTAVVAAEDQPLMQLRGLLELEASLAGQLDSPRVIADRERQRHLKQALLPSLFRKLDDIDPELLSVLDRLDPADEALSSPESLLDARSMLALGVEDASFYLSQPVRTELAEEIDICLSIAGNISESDNSSQMTEAQFLACLDTYLQLLDTDATSAELSGDPEGPFGAQTLRRELSLVVWQRINYLRGYVEETFTAACSLDVQRLPNPLEWAVLASQFRWLADYLPAFFNRQGERLQNMRRLDDMIGQGRQLMAAISQQIDCATGEGAGNRDPLTRAMARYRDALNGLRRQVGLVKEEFERERLRPGSDIRLADGPDQPTGYRPADQAIEPCDPERVCEMNGPLPASRALFGLFPSEFLVADQSGLGEVSLCYDEVSWLDRERQVPRSGDRRMASYTGRLSMVLKGRFRDSTTDPARADAADGAAGDGTIEVFAYQLESPERHEYLFAPNRDEILEDACPMEWVGEKLVAELPERRWQIVPNRLTFLAGARTLPSRLISENWARGAEWRDWFINANNTRKVHAQDGSVIRLNLEQHLAALAIANEAAVYRALLGNQSNAASAALAELNSMALVVRKVAELFYPQQYNAMEDLRRYLTGDELLLDRSGLRRLHQQQVPVSSILPLAEQRLAGLEAFWAGVPQRVRAAGSLPGFVSRSLLQLLDLKQRTEAASPSLGAVPALEPAASDDSVSG